MIDALLNAALVGSGRDAAASLPPESPADRLGAGRGILMRAGLRDAYRRAGHVPPRAPEPFPPLPDVSETVCPLTVEPALRAMIERSSGVPSAPGEAYRALFRRGWMLPPGGLVLALSNTLESPDLLLVLGARGRWLAGLNDAWRRASANDRQPDAEEIERIWREGTNAPRIALIRRLRESNPAGARERVVAGFRTEPADLRQALVESLEVALSPADEPFLEAALDDRSKGVRRAAAALLARLPDSAFVARMVRRARDLVAPRGEKGGFTLHPVPGLPDDWRRDGIDAGPRELEPQLARAIQVLASIPASALVSRLDVTAQEVIEAADRHGAALTLIEAWRANASSADREKLLPALWDAWWARPLKRLGGASTVVQIAQGMNPQVFRERMLHLLSDPPSGTEWTITTVLEAVDAPWPEDLSREALRLLEQWLAGKVRGERHVADWDMLIGPLAAHVAPGAIGDTLTLLERIRAASVLSAWNDNLRQGSSVLELRKGFWYAIREAEVASMTSGGVDGGRGE